MFELKYKRRWNNIKKSHSVLHHKSGVTLTMVRPKNVLRVVLLVNLTLFMLGIIRFGYIYTTDAVKTLTAYKSVVASSKTRMERYQNCSNQDRAIAKANIPTTLSEAKKGEEFLVPNIVHFIWFNTETRTFPFHNMLSVLSAYKILSPEVIYFHTNREPKGPYFERIKAIPTLKMTYREPPTMLFGEKIKEPFYYTSHSNVDRVKVLMEYGGIYLDFDVIVTSPFDDLRKYPCTIGLEQETKACGSVIVCSKASFFLYLWINSYLDDYRIEEWAYNTGQVPFNLARRYPHLVHVDKNRINRPNFKELGLIWGQQKFDWEKNYAVHTWHRLWKDTSPLYKGVEPDEENVKTLNNSFGEMARTMLYGRKEIMDKDPL